MSEKISAGSIIDRITNDTEYDLIHRRLHALIDLGFDNLTPDQATMLDHLTHLIESYDQEDEDDEG